ncbi:MAG: hypothetical protein GYB65_06660 [Chloroflexi bacterium]|nr:hypothetical protein [Chloroflexota bacterium]
MEKRHLIVMLVVVLTLGMTLGGNSANPTLHAQPPGCEATVVAERLNVRADHRTSAAGVGRLTQGAVVEVLALYQTRDQPTREIWAQTVYAGQPAWIALWHDGEELATLADSPACQALLAVYDCGNLRTAWGVWAGPGADGAELLAFGAQMLAQGRTPAVTIYGAPEIGALLYNNGWIVAYRPFIGNCPTYLMPPEIEARIWAAAIEQDIKGKRFTYLIASNECAWPDVAWFVRWQNELLDRMAALGVDHVIPSVAGPGFYEMDWYPALYPVLERVRQQGGCYAMNLYPVDPVLALSARTDFTQYTTFRYELFADLLPPGLPLCVTEFGSAWGHLPPDFDDIQAFVAATDGAFLWANAWYDAMPLHPWEAATLIGQVDALAAAYSAALEN